MTTGDDLPRGRIALVGFMGAGKSTIGAALARRLGWPFVDTDAEVERSLGMPVREIFETQSESAFRAAERRAVEDAVRRERAVIALGGGALECAETVGLVTGRCHVVHLAARPETLRRRLREAPGDRPLLDRGFPASLLAARRAAYAAAHVTVETDRLEPEEIAERIERAWRGGEGRRSA
jgi:shikimate kinase